MVHVNVIDKITSTNLVIFDKLANVIFRGTAAETLHAMHQVYNYISKVSILIINMNLRMTYIIIFFFIVRQMSHIFIHHSLIQC